MQQTKDECFIWEIVKLRTVLQHAAHKEKQAKEKADKTGKKKENTLLIMVHSVEDQARHGVGQARGRGQGDGSTVENMNIGHRSVPERAERRMRTKVR